MSIQFIKAIAVFITMSWTTYMLPQKSNQDISGILIDMTEFSEEVYLDIRYATENNFLEKPFYTCAKCYLQPEVAEALYLANQYFCEQGYYIKFYDCYRPVDMQKLMWETYPNPMYVANPYTKGSIHSRGAAVDITLVDDRGCELDMGTNYDFFGREAHIDNPNLTEKVQENRALLQEGMRRFGFSTIRTEWWHFSFRKNYLYEVLNIPFECP